MKPGNFGSSEKRKGKGSGGHMQVELGTENNRSYSESSMQKLIGSGGFNEDAERDWKCVRKLIKGAAMEGRGYRQRVVKQMQKWITG